MPPEKYDIMFAMKAIGLSEQLSGSDKQVAFAILDHYNRRTGRCDPSRETLSKLVNITPRTVSRSISKLTGTRLFKIARHGGYYNCNSYCPNWRLYRELEEVWKKRRVACSRRTGQQKLAPSSGQNCPLTSDEPVYQTNPSNSILLTSVKVQPSPAQVGQSSRSYTGVTVASAPRKQWDATTLSVEAARSAAEKRWNEDLIIQFGHDASVYGRIVEAVSPQLLERATGAEMQRRGSGLTFLMKELSSLIPLLRDP
ncbi:helix-turn-helix domain-containing protein [Tardiphaga sp. P9-11]|uniref:helix-turn-helix domain-containing protein n=1 Tax=Tardiphaga sp. P9-11 TaxID=2024614 RepID=UPI0011F3C982|nr:helix-turn-helix domain-containing protein [Tardiphaga sp. P9-11]KAA0078149.1 helix-turn-helix domain-containing protein [Tardiphaga sp. P9-11]